MRLVWRNAILILLMLWLPLQGVAATLVPLCEKASQASVEHDHQAHHHEHEGHPAKNPLPCDQCDPCHMCCAMAIPATAIQFSQHTGSEFPAATPTLPTLFIPEQPQRPPQLRTA
jgi:hypothetical protein